MLFVGVQLLLMLRWEFHVWMLRYVRSHCAVKAVGMYKLARTDGNSSGDCFEIISGSLYSVFEVMAFFIGGIGDADGDGGQVREREGNGELGKYGA